jgi:hypothetical protein
MSTTIKCWIVAIGLFLPLSAQAQLPSNRIKPGTLYLAGDTVRSVRLGLTTRIPEGWTGVLPRDTEVFLLMPETNLIGEIYVLVNDKADLQVQRKRWETGVDLTEGLRLQRDGEIFLRGTDIIGTMGKLVGNAANSQVKIYLESKCSPNGFCVSYVATADASSFENVKKALQQFVDNTSFYTPSGESPYKHFDWKKFLKGKILLSFGHESTSKREDQVNLCADGTFQSTITRTGIFKDQAKGYQGKERGKWDVKSNGEKATITFTFDKLPPVDVEIEARDEEIYVKGQRYFVGESEVCR